MDGLGLTMFIPLLESVGGSSGNAENLGKLGFIITGLESIGIHMTLTAALMTMLFFFVLKGLAKYGQGYLVAIYQQYFTRTIRFANINALAQYDYQAFIQADAGRIQNTLSGEVQRVVVAYLKYTRMLQAAMMVVAYLLMAFLANPEFALLVAVAGGLTNFLFSKIYRNTKQQSGALVQSNSRFQGLLIQMVAFFKYLKATGSVSGYSNYLKQQVDAIEQSNRRINLMLAVATGIREPLIVGVVVGVILLQVNVLGGALGAILLSLVLFYRALTSVMTVQSEYNNYLALSGSLFHMEAFIEELQQHKETQPVLPFPGLTTGMECRQVSFSYSQTLVLRSIDLRIDKNETIALVGESGSGKTTLMNMLSGLIRPTKGEISIDGRDLFAYNLPSYQQRIGYITQEPVIFDDTVFNNVTFWAEPTPENLQRCWQALEQASVSDFVRTLPDQLQARLGYNGINLSGGQKQRISIARELYKEVDFLFMDEATSALDSETEKMIQENIDQLKGRYTILIIAHRLSTIKNADKVVVMKEGKIDTIGTYQNLIQQSGSFKRMVELQEL